MQSSLGLLIKSRTAEHPNQGAYLFSICWICRFSDDLELDTISSAIVSAARTPFSFLLLRLCCLAGRSLCPAAPHLPLPESRQLSW